LSHVLVKITKAITPIFTDKHFYAIIFICTTKKNCIFEV